MRNFLASISCSLLLAVAACGGGSSSSPSPAPGPTPEPDPSASECVRSGCSGTICVEPGKEMVTTCEFKPEYACYDQARCERQPNGECGWTPTPELDNCLASGAPSSAP